MTIITATPTNVDQLLDARVEQTRANMKNHMLNMNPQDLGDWREAVNLKEEYVTAMHAQQYNFILQHHLAKTILSTT